MSKGRPTDHSSLSSKIAFRRLCRETIEETGEELVVMETHGGVGEVFKKVWWDVERGVVFESHREKAEILCEQRPHWRVYEAKCENAIRAGIAADLPISVLDVDPWGSAWPTVRAFLASDRETAPVVAVAVNCGLRFKLRVEAWSVKVVGPWVQKYGQRAVYRNYPDICREMLEHFAAPRFEVERWTARLAGNKGHMTHWAAILRRNGHEGETVDSP